MKTRIIASAILLPIFFAALFVFPPYVLTLIISLISAIAAYELMHAVKSAKSKTTLVFTIIAATIVPIAIYFNILYISTFSSQHLSYDSLIPLNLYISTFNLQLFTFNSLVPLLIIFFILMSLLLIEFFLTFKSEKQLKLRQIPIALAAGILIPYMLSSFISLKTMPYGHLFVLFPIISAFLTDSGAYFIGVAIGKRKAFPKISPNKTIEGCIGGLITGTAGIVLYGVILNAATPLNISYPFLIVCGIICAAVTELGDLTFSFIKRKCEIKDYGQLIPGHGGMLDRFDSMILTAPAMYLLIILLPLIN